MGTYLEKNIQTFMEIQRRLQEQSLGKFSENPMLNSESWGQFVKMQGPAIQGLMTSYLEQSAQAFLEMQQQLQKQARTCSVHSSSQLPSPFPPTRRMPTRQRGVGEGSERKG